MAKKKTIKEIKLDVVNLRKLLEQAEQKIDNQRDDLAIKVFSPILENDEICSFFDFNQKNKKVMDYIKEETEKEILYIIRGIEAEKINFDEIVSETAGEEKKLEKTDIETEISEEKKEE